MIADIVPKECVINANVLSKFILTPKSRMAYYRGVSDSSFDLMSSAYRTEGLEQIQSLAKDYILRYSDMKCDGDLTPYMAELAVLMEFHEMANSQGIVVPSIPRLYHQSRFLEIAEASKHSFVPWLDIASLAQHYGLPTRMLDWSKDFLVALFFACKDYSFDVKKDVAVYVLSMDNIANLVDIKFVTPDYSYNPNIRAQSGLFTAYVGPNENAGKTFDQQMSLSCGPGSNYDIAIKIKPD